MKKFLASFLIFLLGSMLVDLRGESSAGGDIILWEQRHIERDISPYKKVVPIRFEGQNVSDRSVEILSAKGDCSSCGSPQLSTSRLAPGDRVRLSSIIRLISTNGKQDGTIAVAIRPDPIEALGDKEDKGDQEGEERKEGMKGEEFIQNLSYSLSFSPPFSVDPDSLLWEGDSKDTKAIKITTDFEQEYLYKGFVVDPALYSVEESSEGAGATTLLVTPVVSPAPSTFLEISYVPGNPRALAGIRLQLSSTDKNAQ
jgi:hypothetical protein